MAQSEQLNELATALAKAQGEFSAIPKTETNPFFKSKYAGLPQVVEAASPILTKLGLSVSQFLGCDDQGDTLTTYLLHSSGQYLSHTMRLHLTKSDAQSQGSATTYARRYSYMAVLGLVADVDDDGNKAIAKVSPPAPKTSQTVPEPRFDEGLEFQVKTRMAAVGLTSYRATKFFHDNLGKSKPETDADLTTLLAALDLYKQSK